MPNYIKNKLTITGNDSEIKKMVEKFSTKYERELNKSYDGNIICKNKEGQFYGWYDDKKNIFRQRGKEDQTGLPDGVEYEYNEEWVRFPDFNKIEPRPLIYDNTISGSCLINGVHIKNPVKRIIKKVDFDEKIMSKSNDFSNNEIREDEIGIVREVTGAELTEFSKLGHRTWYEWCIANWGTKWNCSECEKDQSGAFLFQTAWSGVVDLIVKMSKGFQNVEIHYIYADEDSGCNTGDLIIKSGAIIKGKILENNSNEAYEIFLSLNPNCDYIKKIDGKYKYVE